MGNKNRPKILIVDDEADILHALGLFLKQEGYQVEAITKFENYLAKAQSDELPDVIILDILLNQEDGIKIAKQLKNEIKTKDIPIILISALPDGQKQSDGSGADAFLAKPFDLKDLNETIERVINPSKAKRTTPA